MKTKNDFIGGKKWVDIMSVFYVSMLAYVTEKKSEREEGKFMRPPVKNPAETLLPFLFQLNWFVDFAEIHLWLWRFRRDVTVSIPVIRLFVYKNHKQNQKP